MMSCSGFSAFSMLFSKRRRIASCFHPLQRKLLPPWARTLIKICGSAIVLLLSLIAVDRHSDFVQAAETTCARRWARIGRSFSDRRLQYHNRDQKQTTILV